jgi:hypothetical protein
MLKGVEMKSNSSLCTKLKNQIKMEMKDPTFRTFLPRGTTEIKILYGQMEKESGAFSLFQLFLYKKKQSFV